MAAVEIAPIVKTIEVGRSAADAFRLFTEDIAVWWPGKATRARDADGEARETMTFEPHVGGRILEIFTNGGSRPWGEVIAYEPGARLVFTFLLGDPPGRPSEVDVRFEPLTDHSCRITLTHAHFDGHGPDAAGLAGRFSQGWDYVFIESFGGYAGAE